MDTARDKISSDCIEALLNSAEIEEHTFHGKQHVVSYKFSNGFAVVGVGSCVKPENFDIELGRKYAREQVENKLWELEGYLLANLLAGVVKLDIDDDEE
jgi:hypothetical protein